MGSISLILDGDKVGGLRRQQVLAAIGVCHAFDPLSSVLIKRADRAVRVRVDWPEFSRISQFACTDQVAFKVACLVDSVAI